MPVKQATMAATDVTKKLLIYHTLYRLSLSFSNVVTHCRTLQDAGVFTAKSTKLFQGYAQELQAEMNQELLTRLVKRDQERPLFSSRSTRPKWATIPKNPPKGRWVPLNSSTGTKYGRQNSIDFCMPMEMALNQ